MSAIESVSRDTLASAPRLLSPPAGRLNETCEAPHKLPQLVAHSFVDEFAGVVEYVTGARHHESSSEPRACPQSVQQG
jgi:hypothetical protein